MKKIPLKFSIMITTVALAAMLAGVWLAATYRENDSRAMLLPDRVMTLFPDPKPLTAFALTDHQNRIFDLASLRVNGPFSFSATPIARTSVRQPWRYWPVRATTSPRARPVPKISKSFLSQWIPIVIPLTSSSNTRPIFMRPFSV